MKRLTGYIVIVLVLLGVQSQAQALLVGGPEIIVRPTSVADDQPPGATNTSQQAFNEKQGVTLPLNLSVDGGLIAAGTIVDSHMIFFNIKGNNTKDSRGVKWTFNGTILGVMSDNQGILEEASNGLLGAVGTSYPGRFNNRGLEPGSMDDYSVLDNSIAVTMLVSKPGDWIRVITLHVEPVPAVSGWSMLILALLLVVGLTIHIVKRRTVRA